MNAKLHYCQSCRAVCAPQIVPMGFNPATNRERTITRCGCCQSLAIRPARAHEDEFTPPTFATGTNRGWVHTHRARGAG